MPTTPAPDRLPGPSFGFVETASFGQGDRVDHAQLAWPEGGGVMLGSERDDGVQVTGPGSFSCGERLALRHLPG